MCMDEGGGFAHLIWTARINELVRCAVIQKIEKGKS